MARTNIALSVEDVLAAGGGMQGLKDVLSTVVQDALQELIEAELTARLGAGRWERSEDRSGMRNGSRSRTVSTPAEDYHERLNDPDLQLDEHCILVMRNTGPIGYPGSGEVVNMQPPAALLERGITSLPTMGDGRQSGTADSPSILNASPESVAGGGLAILRTGDQIRIDLKTCRVDVQLSDEDIAQRWAEHEPVELVNQTPRQQLYRETVGPLSTSGCMEFAVAYQDVASSQGMPRDSH